MTVDEAERSIEPAAWMGADQRNAPDGVSVFSIAVSLKRIADALERTPSAALMGFARAQTPEQLAAVIAAFRKDEQS